MEFKPRLKVWQGSNRKNEFDPKTNEARSYKHWCYVKKIKGYWVFNDYNYSVTTNGHQGEMKGFLRDTLKVKKIIYVDQRESLTDGLFLDSQYEKLALAEVRLKHKNRKKEFYDTQKEIIKKTKKEIEILKKLGAKSKGTLKEFIRWSQNEETERLNKQRELSKIAREKRANLLKEHKNEFESLGRIEV